MVLPFVAGRAIPSRPMRLASGSFGPVSTSDRYLSTVLWLTPVHSAISRLLCSGCLSMYRLTRRSRSARVSGWPWVVFSGLHEKSIASSRVPCAHRPRSFPRPTCLCLGWGLGMAQGLRVVLVGYPVDTVKSEPGFVAHNLTHLVGPRPAVWTLPHADHRRVGYRWSGYSGPFSIA